MAGDGASIGTLLVDIDPKVTNFWSKVMAQVRPGAGQFGTEVGNAAAKGIQDALAKGVVAGVKDGAKQAATDAGKSGEEIGTAVGKGIKDRVAKGVGDGVDAGARTAAPKAAKAGEESGGRFADTFRKRVEAALKALPDAKIGAATNEAEQKIKDLRAELATLSGKKIGVDIDAGAAIAKVAELEAELVALGERSPNVQVKVDAAAAAAKLAEVGAEARAVGQEDPTINVHADTSGATAQIAAVGAESAISAGGMQGLISAGIALGPAIIPAAAAAAAALAAIGPAALIGASGIGVMALALGPVIGAFKAADAVQQQAGSSAATAASKQLQLASAADAVKSAQAGLANTLASAADSQRHASETIANAVLAEADANRQLENAQRAATQARIDAARAAEDLSSRVAHNALDQRQAALDLQSAKGGLTNAKTAAGGNLAAPSVVAAQLAYDQVAQRVEDLRVDQKRLADDKAKSDKQGIDGSTQVVAAVDKVRLATEAVHKAEQATADARLAYAAQARQNEFSIAQAKQGVINAERSLQQAEASANNATGAVDKLQQALAKLSPAGLAFYNFLQSLKPQFDALSKVAQEGLLPGLQAGLSALLPVLPQISTFVGQVAKAFGDMFATLGKALADPFWVTFFQQIGTAAGPIMQSFATIIANLGKAFATLLLAFVPLSTQMGAGLADLATKFAAFVTAWVQSDGFTKFVDYVKVNGPLLLGLFGDIVVVALKLAIALAPLGQLIVQGLSALAGWLAKLSPGQLIAVAAGIGAIVAAIVIAVGGPVAAIVAGVTLVVAALVYAYTHWEKFRAVVDYVAKVYVAYVQTIIAVSMWLWQNVLVPAWAAITAAVTTANTIISPILNYFAWVIRNILAPVFMFLWHQVVEPAWQGISLAASVAWAAIQVIFGVMQIGIKILGGWWRFLYDGYIKPVWEGAILPLLRVVGNFIADNVAPAWRRAIDALGQIFDGLRDKVKIPIRFIIQTVLNDGLLGAYNWIASKFGVKPDNVSVALPKGFATGGYITGPGGPTDDAILARLSAGEYVIPARVVSTLGVDFFNQLIGTGGTRSRQYQGDGSEGLRLPGFADGGLVGWLKSAWNTVSDPVGALKDRVAGLFGQIPATGAITDVVKGVGNKLLGGTIDYVRRAITNVTSTDGAYTGPISADVASVQNWIRAQQGKPYIWAGAGPEGWDCSGFVGSVILALQGQNPYHRIFSTSNEAGFIRKPAWTSPLTVGWANAGERGGGDVGHTAGNLAGLAFESGGALGNVHSGAGSTPVTSFAHVGSYDSGGWLMPGMTIARNDTGRPEAILTGDQWQALVDSKGRGGDTHWTVNGSPGMSVHELAAAVAGEMAWQQR